MKRIILVIIFSITISAQIPITGNFPAYRITVDTNASSGQLLFSPYNSNTGPFSPPFLAIMNNDGTFMYIKQLALNAYDFKMQPNGNFTYFDSNKGVYYELDKGFNIIDSFYAKNGYSTDTHELQLLQNGNALLLGQDDQKVDMSQIVEGGNPNAIVVGCILQELNPFKNVIFQWRSWDHYKITDVMPDINLLDSIIDYVHANAIDVDTDGNFLLSARHLDEITKINRTTGDIIWRLGGKNNQFHFINDTIGFSHQHCIRKIANGDITMFDNGNLHKVQISRAVEYKLDETNKTATLVWEYKNDPVIYSSAMGSVQRLDNGNTVIGWGVNMTNNVQITEVTNIGKKVFEIEIPYTWSYRSFRFNVQSVALNENITESYNYTLFQNFPNPFNPITTINYSIPIESSVNLIVYNAIGEKVRDLVSGIKRPGDYSVDFNAADLRIASGVYFYAFTIHALHGEQYFHSVKKMIVLK